MANQYDAQASTNYKEAFSLFDKRGNGRVQLDNLGDLLRACGQNPTMTEIRDLEKSVGGDCEYLYIGFPDTLAIDRADLCLRELNTRQFAANPFAVRRGSKIVTAY